MLLNDLWNWVEGFGFRGKEELDKMVGYIGVVLRLAWICCHWYGGMCSDMLPGMRMQGVL